MCGSIDAEGMLCRFRGLWYQREKALPLYATLSKQYFFSANFNYTYIRIFYHFFIAPYRWWGANRILTMSPLLTFQNPPLAQIKCPSYPFAHEHTIIRTQERNHEHPTTSHETQAIPHMYAAQKTH